MTVVPVVCLRQPRASKDRICPSYPEVSAVKIAASSTMKMSKLTLIVFFQVAEASHTREVTWTSPRSQRDASAVDGGLPLYGWRISIKAEISTCLRL